MHYWETKEGKTISVKRMETNHIINCIGYLERKFDKNGKVIVLHQYGGSGSEASDFWYDEEYIDETDKVKEWIDIFEKELMRRGIDIDIKKTYHTGKS